MICNFCHICCFIATLHCACMSQNSYRYPQTDSHHFSFYSAPVKCVRSIVISLCVCLSASISHGTAGPIFTQICNQVPCGRGSVLLHWCCDTLCSSSFMDDVTLAAVWYRGGVWSDVYECLVWHAYHCKIPKLSPSRGAVSTGGVSWNPIQEP